MANKGAFITLYGVNNMGKTTHVRLLAKRLEGLGFMVKTIKYPMYELEPTGSFINSVLRGDGPQGISEDEFQLWYVLNRYQYQPELKRLLEEGYIVIAEDYSGTGIAWGMAKGGDENWLCETNKYLLKEDLAVMIEGDRQVQAKESKHIHEQNDGLMDSCRLTHEHLAEKYRWKRMTLQDRKEDTANLLWKIVEEFLVESGCLEGHVAAKLEELKVNN